VPTALRLVAIEDLKELVLLHGMLEGAGSSS
jgi:hypothetical protein